MREDKLNFKFCAQCDFMLFLSRDQKLALKRAWFGSLDHGRRHGFESGGTAGKKFLTPTFWPVGGQNTA